MYILIYWEGYDHLQALMHFLVNKNIMYRQTDRQTDTTSECILHEVSYVHTYIYSPPSINRHSGAG